MMRATRRIFLPSFLLVGCGGEQSGTDASLDGRATDAPVDVAADAADVIPTCTYQTCDGSAQCPINATCPVGDNSNDCICVKDNYSDGGYKAWCSQRGGYCQKGKPCSSSTDCGFGNACGFPDGGDAGICI